MPNHPPHLKIQRAKAFVDNAGLKRLTVCEACGAEKYILCGILPRANCGALGTLATAFDAEIEFSNVTEIGKSYAVQT